ncbi:hypothetical protein [Peristeroidobacter soli]|jgi:hypothetical protein|uniref:hypothetical protein n=1 Tax=Peristeroidobacter soli TaxID=2497877 RepID=UPI00158C4E51|nr:hypothetical protein [Peristeroidobacter soli]
MVEIKADKEADMGAVVDDGESTSLMMPLLIGEGARQRAELTDLAIKYRSHSRAAPRPSLMARTIKL